MLHLQYHCVSSNHYKLAIVMQLYMQNYLSPKYRKILYTFNVKTQVYKYVSPNRRVPTEFLLLVLCTLSEF